MPVTKKELITVSLISVYYQYIAVWHRSNIGENGLCILILWDNYNQFGKSYKHEMQSCSYKREC